MNESIKENTEQDKHENVMLLAMSTLPFKPKVNTYQVRKDDEVLYFKSLSQMEPHTKYVLQMLAACGERLNRIVILESSKARTEKPENWNQETATTLFAKRIYNYLGSHEKVDIEVQDELADLKETPCDQHMYTDGFPELVAVDLDNPVFFWEAVKAIQGTENNMAIHLYMDMQGGDRNAVSQMNAIAELLVRQKVIIKGRFANDFEPKRNPPLHTIRDAGKEYRTYDLISAMDIFSRYGWGDKLEEYFKGEGHGGSKERKLIEAINQASQSISRCNADGFDHAVRRIENLEREFENPETVTEMDVVYEDIYKDYKPLFGVKYRYVAQIRWCLDKHFLQQALTILEAKMPCEFVRSGLIYYMTCSGDKEEFLKTCENIYEKMERNQRYRMKDLNHYLIKDYCYDYKKRCFQDPGNLLTFGLDAGGKDETISLLDEYRKLCKSRNQINHASAAAHNPDGFFCYMKRRHKDDSNWRKNKNSDYEKRIREFLDKWEELARKVTEELQKQIIDLS